MSKKLQAVRSPATLTEVLDISKILSTPKTKAIPAAGIPTVARIVAKIIIPTPGAEGVPIDAPTVMATINKILKIDR